MDDRQAAELRAALDDAGLASRPVAVLDLDAVDHNLADLTRRAAGKPIRVASKSLRVRRLLEHALATDGFRGTLAYTLPEALWLAGHGLTDLVVAYPTADRPALARLAADDRARAAITLMVDSTQHLDLIDAAAPGHPRSASRSNSTPPTHPCAACASAPCALPSEPPRGWLNSPAPPSRAPASGWWGSWPTRVRSPGSRMSAAAPTGRPCVR